MELPLKTFSPASIFFSRLNQSKIGTYVLGSTCVNDPLTSDTTAIIVSDSTRLAFPPFLDLQSTAL